MYVDASILQACAPGLQQEASATNLGYGNLYYALVRMLRPQHVVVIGSGYGFTPVVAALALAHNGQGKLTFVDPSMSKSREGHNAAHGGTGQWDTPDQVRQRFSCAGVPPGIVTHFKETSEQFFSQYESRRFAAIELAIIDGAHDEHNASFDLAAVLPRLRKPGYVLMHDATHFLNRTGHMGVSKVLARVEPKSGVEMVLFPGRAGLALLRFTAEPGIEVQMAPPPSVFWPVAGVFVAGMASALIGRSVVKAMI